MISTHWLARSVLASLLVLTSATSCSNDPNSPSALSSAERQSLEEILTATGSTEIFLLISDENDRSQLHTLDKNGFRKSSLNPLPTIFSMITAAKDQLVLTAGGFDGGPGSDTLLWADGQKIKLVTNPLTSRVSAPALASNGQLAALALEEEGQSMVHVLYAGPFHKGIWQPTEILRNQRQLGPAAWGPADQLVVSIGNQGTGEDELLLYEKGKALRNLGPGGCTLIKLWGDAEHLALGNVIMGPGFTAPPQCRGAFVLNIKTKVREYLPAGWNPRVWTSDCRRLVISKNNQLGLWTPGQSGITTRVSTPAEIVQAAPISAATAAGAARPHCR